jgi:PAS domain S-box-containing protein
MKQILVVDNHPVMLKFMTGHLEKKGHQVVTAEDGVSALKVLESFRPDVCFIDLVMPNISGDKLCKVIRNRAELDSCFVAVLSAIVVEEEVSAADFEADLLLAKGPFDRLSYYLDFILWHLEQGCEDRLKGMVVGQEELFKREITRELLDSTRHYERTLTHMSEGVMELVEGGIIVYVNPAAVSITGVAEKDLLSGDFVDLFELPDREYVQEAIDAAAGRRREVEPERLLCLNGRQVRIQCIPVTSQNLQKNLLVLMQDLTEQKKAEAKLFEQQEALEQSNAALARRARFERLISEISSHLIGLRPDEMDAGIDRALASIGTFTGADRAYVFLSRNDGERIDNTHEWCAEGIESQKGQLQDIAMNRDLPWFAQRIKTQEVLHIADVTALPPEARATREILEAQNILSLLIVPMASAGRLIGFLGFDAVRERRSWTENDQAVLSIVGESFAHLIERRRAEKALRESENKLRRLSEQLIRAQEKERRRIAVELHDELGQSLMALKLKLRAACNSLGERNRETRPALEEALEYIDEIADKVRWTSSELRPAILEDLGLSAALGKLAEETARHGDIRVETDIDDIQGLVSYEQEVLLYRIFQEAMTNALKHAGAESVWFAVRRSESALHCVIEDNGRGLSASIGGPAQSIPAGLGLSIMEERVHMLAGELDIQSSSGSGTRIAFTVPLEAGETK